MKTLAQQRLRVLQSASNPRAHSSNQRPLQQPELQLPLYDPRYDMPSSSSSKPAQDDRYAPKRGVTIIGPDGKETRL